MPHYYDKTGVPHHFVPKKTGTGERPTTIRDARENNWLPGVTTILDILSKPGLERWKIQQAVQAVVTAPDIAGEGLDRKIERVLNEERQQDQESINAMERGTQIHAAIEGYFLKGDMPADMAPWAMPAVEYIKNKGGTVAHVEKVLVGDGYAGKADLILHFDENHALIVDFKTAKKLPENGSGKGAWPEHQLQLGAYSKAYSRDIAGMKVDVGNLYISTVNPGQLAWFSSPWGPAAEAFEAVLHVWRFMNGFPA